MSNDHFPAKQPKQGLAFDPRVGSPLISRGLQRFESLAAQPPEPRSRVGNLIRDRLLKFIELEQIDIELHLHDNNNWDVSSDVISLDPPWSDLNWGGSGDLLPAFSSISSISMPFYDLVRSSEIRVMNWSTGKRLTCGAIQVIQPRKENFVCSIAPVNKWGIGGIVEFDPFDDNGSLKEETTIHTTIYPVMPTRPRSLPGPHFGWQNRVLEQLDPRPLVVFVDSGQPCQQIESSAMQLGELSRAPVQRRENERYSPVLFDHHFSPLPMHILTDQPQRISLAFEGDTTPVCSGLISDAPFSNDPLHGFGGFGLRDCHDSGLTAIIWIHKYQSGIYARILVAELGVYVLARE